MEIIDILGLAEQLFPASRKDTVRKDFKALLQTRLGQVSPENYTERREAEIIALDCTKLPDGRRRWSLTLLTEELKKKKKFETINRETVRLILERQNKTLAEKNVVYQDNRCCIQSTYVRYP